MKFSASTVLLAAALGVSAHPHGAAHPHARRDTNLEVRDTFFKNAKPTTTVYQTVTVNAVNAAAAPTTTSVAAVASSATSSAAAASSSASSGGNVGSGGSYTGTFCSGSSKRATTEEIAYAGNVGSGTYGCNVKLVSQSEAKNYQYISVLENAASEKQVCACFLKIGADGGVNGFWKGNQVLDFTLAAGESKYLAVEAESIGGCSCGVGSLPTTSIGQISGVWFEWEFGNKNAGYTGGDASSLVPEAAGQTFQGMTLTEESDSSKVSIIYPNGDGCNAFPKGTENENGHGFNIANTLKGQNAVRYHAKWGTTGTLADCPSGNIKQTRA